MAAPFADTDTGTFHIVETGPAHPRGPGLCLLLREVQDRPTHFDYREVEQDGEVAYFPTEDAARQHALALGATHVVRL